MINRRQTDRDRGGGESEGRVGGEKEADMAIPRLCCAVSCRDQNVSDL